MEAKTIIVVDDEHEIADLLGVYLTNEGYSVRAFYNSRDAIEFIDRESVSLAILDVMMPEIDGFTLCKMIRQKYLFPIIMLTARVEDIDKIHGLSLGADDYIVKPFNPLEVVARVKTQLRRYTRYNVREYAVYDSNGLYISEERHKCTLNGEALQLTPIEFSILLYLCKKRGKVISSDELFENVWHEKYYENDNNTVMAHIARIREKMKEPARKPKYIKTVWGVGYTIE